MNIFSKSICLKVLHENTDRSINTCFFLLIHPFSLVQNFLLTVSFGKPNFSQLCDAEFFNLKVWFRIKPSKFNQYSFDHKIVRFFQLMKLFEILIMILKSFIYIVIQFHWWAIHPDLNYHNYHELIINDHH